MQVVSGIAGIDAPPADARDLSADFVNWEWSWPHTLQTSLDMVEVIPLVEAVKPILKPGVKALKHADEAAALVKNGNKALEAGTQVAKNADELSLLKNTENFTDSAIEHIFEGQVNARGKAVGYHYEGIKNTAGKIIPGTESKVNNLGVYQAQVEVNGIAKNVNNGYSSSFFPKNMNPQEVINNINQAYTNRVYIRGNRFRGISSSGIEIEMFLDNNNNIISAFPIYK